MRHRNLVVAIILMLVGAACGTRLDDGDFLATTGDTGPGQALPGQGTTGTTLPGVTTGGRRGGTGGRTGTGTNAGSGGSGVSAGPGTGGSGGGGGGTGSGGSGGPNTASDVGVTPTSIKVGNITGIQGLLGPESFTPLLEGAQAYFAALNDRGGVNGRKIQMITCDDRDNNEQSNACVRKLIDQDKVFALVANSSTAYDSAASYTNSKGVPDIGGGPIGNAYWRYPHLYGILGGDGYDRDDGDQVGTNGKLSASTGVFRWFKQKLGVKKAAVFFYTIAISRQAGLNLLKPGLEREGIEVVYYGGGSDRGREATDPNYDSDVIEMRDEGVDNVWNAIDIAGFQKLCNAMDRQDFTVKASVATVQGWGDRVGETFSAPCRNTVFANDDWRGYGDRQHPAVAEMLQAMARYKPNEDLRQWHMWGWAAAMMFTDGVASMGGNVTRAGLEKWLNQWTPEHSYEAKGLAAAGDIHWKQEDLSAPERDCFNIGQWQDAAATFVLAAKPFTCFTTPRFSYSPSATG